MFIIEALKGILNASAFGIDNFTWGSVIMIGISFCLMFLAIKCKFEPLLLLPIAFGMFLSNIPVGEIFHMTYFVQESSAVINWSELAAHGGLFDYLYLGVKLGIYPCLIFMGVGAMTDFKPLIANPKSLLLGAAAQFGVFAAFIGALLLGFSSLEAAAIGIIGGADGPTAILVTKELAPQLLGAIAIAAYSYMALVPLIQPPIMKALTTKKERMIKMEQLRPVSKTEEILFPIVCTLVIAFILPDATPLVGCLMLGNLAKVSGVVDRIAKTMENELCNIVTIFLGLTVGATATADSFFNSTSFLTSPLGILILGLFAFAFATAGGVLFGKIMCFVTKGKINPLIGSAGVSAVPMAARVSQQVGQKENPSNFLLMHAMGPNVAGVIGSAVAAGVFLTIFR
ncbi:MAG: sodium ion-translocating decarboxylase subunit beta [Clostridiales bacterium]|nr:sodium ion-translocating decarboxylase subunit beta [Clostridiales bacterium]